MKNDLPPILSFDEHDYVNKAAIYLRNTISKLIREKSNISVALSGGNSPLPIYKKLSLMDLEWEKIKFFLVDERCVPNNDIESNYGNIKKFLFDFIPSQSFPMVIEKTNFEIQALKYEETLKTQTNILNGTPQLDLVILGMGLDGHTASLFPNTEALTNKENLVILNKITQLNTYRITMTYPLILNSNKIILIAKGEKKKKIIDDIYRYDYPISKLIHKVDVIIN